MGSIPVKDSDFFFVPRSCHVDQFTFHITKTSLCQSSNDPRKLPKLKNSLFFISDLALNKKNDWTSFGLLCPYHGPVWVNNPHCRTKYFIADFANWSKTWLSFNWTLRLWHFYGFRGGNFLSANNISCPTSTAASLRTGRPLCNVPPETEDYHCYWNFSDNLLSRC